VDRSHSLIVIPGRTDEPPMGRLPAMSEAKASPRPLRNSLKKEGSSQPATAQSSSWNPVPLSNSYAELVERLNRNTPEKPSHQTEKKSRPVLGLNKGKTSKTQNKTGPTEARANHTEKTDRSHTNQPSVIVDVDIAEYTQPTSRASANAAVDVDLSDAICPT